MGCNYRLCDESADPYSALMTVSSASECTSYDDRTSLCRHTLKPLRLSTYKTIISIVVTPITKNKATTTREKGTKEIINPWDSSGRTNWDDVLIIIKSHFKKVFSKKVTEVAQMNNIVWIKKSTYNWHKIRARHIDGKVSHQQQYLHLRTKQSNSVHINFTWCSRIIQHNTNC